jgi:hypothetical protein
MTDEEYVASLRKLAADLREAAERFESQAARMGEFVAVQLQRIKEEEADGA